MLINPAWRILSIGDGDLSFSASIAQHIKPKLLVATVYDDYKSLMDKYSNEFFNQLTKENIQIVTSVDVTDCNTWKDIPLNSFDLVIFQFPLVPNSTDFKTYKTNQKIGSSNTVNRWLLNQFLFHSFESFLAKDGQRLTMITSKDVKPYRQWNIETSIIENLSCHYIGQCDFHTEDYPNYQVRNVDRNKFVKETQSISYFYSDKSHSEIGQHLVIPDYCHADNFCKICRVGPITTAIDWQAHLKSKRHHQMDRFEQQWQSALNQISSK